MPLLPLRFLRRLDSRAVPFKTFMLEGFYTFPAAEVRARRWASTFPSIMMLAM